MAQIKLILQIFWLAGRRSAWTKHFVHQVELHSSLRLVLGDRKQTKHVEMRLKRCVTVPMLIDQPLVLGGIRVTGTDVLRLQMLKLAVNVVAFGHCDS